MFRIENATKEHIPLVRDIAFRTWPVAYGDILVKDQLVYMLELMYSGEALARQMDQGHCFLLAYESGTPQGFASFEHDADQKITRLQKLYVLPTVQGSGSGSALLKAVVAAAQEQGSMRVRLNVNRSNKAQEFYKAKGFGIVRHEVIDIGQGFVMDDHVLELDLLKL